MNDITKCIFNVIWTFSIAICLISCSPDPVDTTGSISGIVYDKNTADGLSGVSIVLFLDNGSLTTTTDYNGHYSFVNVNYGNYRLKASKDGYEGQFKEVPVEAGKNISCDFHLQPQNNQVRYYYYELALNTDFQAFGEDATRSEYTHEWNNGDCLFVYFPLNRNILYKAVYYNGKWGITTDNPLTETENGICTTTYIPNAKENSSSLIPISNTDCAYKGEACKWRLNNNQIVIWGTLSPLTGRIRFIGKAGGTYSLNGLSYYTNYNTDNQSLAIESRTLSIIIGENGYSPYYYTFFTNSEKRELTCIINYNSGYRRSFKSDVLEIGSSGYINLPSEESHDNWTLVNLDNNEVISDVVFSSIIVTDIGSSSISLKTNIISTGNGHINESGFLLSEIAGTTLNTHNVVKEICTDNLLEFTFYSLKPNRDYYVKAYAINESGISYSEELKISTLATMEGLQMDGIKLIQYNEDENWNENFNTSSFILIGFGEDHNWN